MFLETFLESVGLKDWFNDISNARVYKEYKNIDMYITNNERHIIIENKINAGDQDRQIERYIEIIAKESHLESSDMDSSELESSESETTQAIKAYENIAVLYLALHKRMPSRDSLGEWEIQGDFLVNGDNQVRFRAITYKKEILEWIKNSQVKVGCITHLNSALYFYKDVVQIITNTKENTMSIEKFLTNKKDNKMQENMAIVFEILKNKDKIMESYCEVIIEKHKADIESKGFEIIKTSKDKKMGSYNKSDLSYPLMIKPKDCGKYYFAFCVEHYIKKGKYTCYGVRIFEQDLNDNVDDNISSNIIDYLHIKFVWWLNYDGNFWWYALDTSMAELESNLQAFLDSSEIKELNEKLKDYQG